MFPLLSFDSPPLSLREPSTQSTHESLMDSLRHAKPQQQSVILQALFQDLNSQDRSKAAQRKFAFLHNHGWDLQTLALKSVFLNDFSYLLENVVKKAANAPHLLLRQRAYWICGYLIRHSYVNVYRVTEEISSSKLSNFNRYVQQEGLAYYTLLFQRRPDVPFQEDATILETARKVAAIFELSNLPIEKDSARLFHQTFNDFQKRRSALYQDRS